MDLKVLEYIVAIAEEHSISRAAERFYLSQADLSRHIKNVEEEMGTRLFVRAPRGVQTTQAGIIFVNDARAILRMATELSSQLATMRHQQQNLIHVMTDSPFYNRFVRLVLPRFQALHPDYTLEIISCNALQAKRALLDGTADLGVFSSFTLRPAGLECLPLSYSDLYLAFPKTYEGPTGIGGLKQAIDRGMFIILYPVGSTMRTIQEQHLAANQIFPTQILEGNTKDSIDHIISKETCGILISSFCTPDIKTRLTLGDLFCRIYNVVAYSPNVTLSAAYHELIQIIMDEFPQS